MKITNKNYSKLNLYSTKVKVLVYHLYSNGSFVIAYSVINEFLFKIFKLAHLQFVRY